MLRTNDQVEQKASSDSAQWEKQLEEDAQAEAERNKRLFRKQFSRVASVKPDFLMSL